MIVSKARWLAAAGASFALALHAGAAGAVANLTDVRVGVHGDHTRIVLETDGKAPYVVDASDREVLVHVDAAATAEAVTARSPHLIWVKVEPTQLGADVRVQLKQPVEVKALVLTRPDRIVLDLYPKAGAPAPLPETAPLPAPEMLPVEEPDLASAMLPEPLPAPEAEAELEPGAEPAPEAGELTGTGGAEVEPAPLAEAEPAPGPLAAAPEAPAAEAQPPVAAPAQPTTPAAPAPTGSLFGSPYLLGAAAAVLLVLFVWLRRRLHGAERAALPPLGVEDAEMPFEPPRAARPISAALDDSLFDVESDAIGALPKPDKPPASAFYREEPEPADETERRVAHLEKRIEELVDAREKLERQLAAQTEELRVQRAAIARTQRVLRTLAPRGDEEPSEPLGG